MKILVACEESQAVCIELRKLGHEAFSCDVQECSGDKPEWHIKGDVIEQLTKGWDMMIAFPPCTYLSSAGLHWNNRIEGRSAKTKLALSFVQKLMNAPIDKIAIENPVGRINTSISKASQIIEPYYFGDNEKKRTCLWLKNLPLLQHFKETDLFDVKTHIDRPKPKYIDRSGKARYFTDALCGPERQKQRSKTFPGIAKAMAMQWT